MPRILRNVLPLVLVSLLTNSSFASGEFHFIQHNSSHKLSFPITSFSDLAGFLKSVDSKRLLPEDRAALKDLRRKTEAHAIMAKIELGLSIGAWIPLASILVSSVVGLIWSKNLCWVLTPIKITGTLGIVSTFTAFVSAFFRRVAASSLHDLVNRANNMDLYDRHGLRKTLVVDPSYNALVPFKQLSSPRHRTNHSR